MKYDVEVFKKQYPVLNDFVYHYVCYKVLMSYYNLLPSNTEFWVRTTDAHLKTAVISWCMVFGADSNPIHWKSAISESEKIVLIPEFRNIIFQKCNFNSSSWHSYWESIINFRNHFIAHKVLDFDSQVPYFDKAFEVAINYDIWLRKIMQPDVFDSILLINLSDQYHLIISSMLKQLMLNDNKK